MTSKKGGSTYEILTGCGNMSVTIPDNLLDGKFRLKLAKAGSCAFAQCEAIGRMVTVAASLGADMAIVASQLNGIRCPQPTRALPTTPEVLSCADAFSQILTVHLALQKGA